MDNRPRSKVSWRIGIVVSARRKDRKRIRYATRKCGDFSIGAKHQ